VALVAVVVLAASGCGSSTDTTVGQTSTSIPPTSEVTTPLVWSPCGDAAECATLVVPADWTEPNGPTLDIAVARRPATGESAGTLFVNPGGPGGTAVDRVVSGAWPAVLLERFDLVSWDPRGVGRSTNLDCTGVGGRNGTNIHRNPTDVAALERFVAACTAGSPDLVDHLGTAQGVADLDTLRVGLGIDRINYLGFSYGTYLGLAYLRQYPDAVRTMVLDGVVDPADDLEALLGSQAAAMEEFVTIAGAQPGGPNLFDVAAATPGVDPTTLAFATIATTYSPSGAGQLRMALNSAIAGDPTALVRLADRYFNGGSFTAYLGTLCSDLPHPPDPVAHAALAERITDVSPRLGAAIAAEVAGCALWPGGETTPWQATTADSPAVVIVVGATGDRATPLEAAEAVHAALRTSSLIVHEADGHTSLDASPCVQRLVVDAIVSGNPPPVRSRCVGAAAAPSVP